LRGVVHAVGDGAGLLLLGFGAEVAQGVARHALGAEDLAELDPTIELLFLLELQRAVLDQHGRLAERLDEARARAARAADTDPLTGLANRRAMRRRLDAVAGRRRAGFALMQLDLDHFKTVNDTFGHAAGDQVLLHVARALRAELRAEDAIARIGGDEFLVLMEGIEDEPTIGAIAARLIARIERPLRLGCGLCRVSGSIGIATARLYDRPDVEAMQSDADAAVYAAKAEGSGRWRMARPGIGGARAVRG
jgi:diguanylate cyclase (GGDEF)-like protein